jgi:hypothetical protein
MNEPGKSDKPVVPLKFAKLNYWDFHQEIIERMEGRGLAKENGEALPSPEDDVQDIFLFAEPAKQVDRTQSRLGKGDTFSQDLHSALDRIRQAACRDKSSLSGGSSGRHHPRQEPGAINSPAGIRAGGGGQPPSLPRH